MLKDLSPKERAELLYRLRKATRKYPTGRALLQDWKLPTPPSQSIGYFLKEEPLTAIENSPSLFQELPGALGIEPTKLYGEKIAAYHHALQTGATTLAFVTPEPSVVPTTKPTDKTKRRPRQYRHLDLSRAAPAIDAATIKRFAPHLKLYLQLGQHPLNAKQVKVVEDVIADIEAGNRSGYIKRPTGTGKTVIFCAILDALQSLNEEFIEEGSDGMLVLVDTINTAEQTYETLTVKERRNSDQPLFGWDEDQVSIYYGSGKNATAAKKGAALGAPTVIMTVDAYRELEKSGEPIQARRRIVMVDEIDSAKGTITTPMMRSLTQNNYVLGFSATDRYVSENGLVRIGPELFNREGPIHETTLVQAAKDKEISPIRNVIFVTDLQSKAEWNSRGEDREYTSAESTFIVNQPGRDDALVHSIVNFKDPETNIAFRDLNQIWFCFGIGHAQRIANKLNLVFQDTKPDGSRLYPYGYAMAVSGKTPKEDWKDAEGKHQPGLKSIIDLHKTGAIPALSNADLFIRSFDSKRTELGVIARVSRSPSLVEQTGGRITRLMMENPHRLGYVATFLDQDTYGALTFTDIAGSPLIGMQPGASYRTINPPRIAHLDRLKPDQEVKVHVYFEPRDIEQFFTKRKEQKRMSEKDLLPLKPDGLLFLDEMIERTGLLPWEINAFYTGIMRTDVLWEDPHATEIQIGQTTIQRKDIAYFRHPKSKTAKTANTLALPETYVEPIKAWYAEFNSKFEGDERVYNRTAWFSAIWFSSGRLETIFKCDKPTIDKVMDRLEVVPGQIEQYIDPLTGQTWRIKINEGDKGKKLIHRDDMWRFKSTYNFGAPLKTADWLTAEEINDLSQERFPLGNKHVTRDYCIKVLARTTESDPPSADKIDPVTGEKWRIEIRKVGMLRQTIAPCLHTSEYERFVKSHHLDIQPRPYHSYPAAEVAQFVGSPIAAVEIIMQRLIPVKNKPGIRIDPQNGREWKAEIAREEGQAKLFLRGEDLNAFSGTYFLLDTVSEQWLSTSMIAERLSAPLETVSKILRRLQVVSDSTVTNKNMIDPKTKDLWQILKQKHPNRTSIYLHQTELPRFKTKYGLGDSN